VTGDCAILQGKKAARSTGFDHLRTPIIAVVRVPHPRDRLGGNDKWLLADPPPLDLLRPYPSDRMMDQPNPQPVIR